jgi:hypothetical protein
LTRALLSCGFVAFVAIEALDVRRRRRPDHAGTGAADVRGRRGQCSSTAAPRSSCAFFVYAFPIEVGLSYGSWRAIVTVCADVFVQLRIAPQNPKTPFDLN